MCNGLETPFKGVTVLIMNMMPKSTVASRYFKSVAAGALALLAAASFTGCETTGGDAALAGTGKNSILINADRVGFIAMHPWKLVSMQKGDTVYTSPNPVTLSIDPDGKVAGRAPINRYFGSMSFNRNGLVTWGDAGFGSTKMAGPDELMSLESIFFDALLSVDYFYRQEGQLVGRDNKGWVLVFERTSEI